MSRGKPILLDRTAVQELVAPHELEDVLQTLCQLGAIESFLMDSGKVAVTPSPDQRMDIALFHIDARESVDSEPGRKRPLPAGAKPRPWEWK